MAGLQQTVDDGGGLSPGVKLLLLLRELRLELLELRQLLHHLGLLGGLRLSLCLDLGGWAAPLRANLEHVGASAVLNRDGGGRVERLGDLWVHVDGQVLLEDKLGVTLVDSLVDPFEKRGAYTFVSELPLADGPPAATGGRAD